MARTTSILAVLALIALTVAGHVGPVVVPGDASTDGGGAVAVQMTDSADGSNETGDGTTETNGSDGSTDGSESDDSTTETDGMTEERRVTAI